MTYRGASICDIRVFPYRSVCYFDENLNRRLKMIGDQNFRRMMYLNITSI